MKKRSRRGNQFQQWWKTHHKKVYLWTPIGVVGALLLVQLLYPYGRVVPFQTIDTLAVGGWQKQDAAWELAHQNAASDVQIIFGERTQAQHSPAAGDLGISANYEPVIEAANYAWYWRLVPTSIFWLDAVNNADVAPSYHYDDAKIDEYMEGELGGSCRIAPINATAEVSEGEIRAVPAENGGTCEEDEVRAALTSAEPVLAQNTEVRIAMEEVPAELQKDDVQPLVDAMNAALEGGIQVAYDGGALDIAADDVRSWLEFSTEENTLQVNFSEAAGEFLNEQLAESLNTPAGVSKITTRDFVEVSRENGATGRAFEAGKTLDELRNYLLGKTDKVEAATRQVAPREEYTRQYSSSDRGLSALMQHFAEDNDGVYGASLIELDGKRRRAGYQDTRKFTTASTYKLYVAYSALKRVESGEMKWSDQIAGGRDLAKCFDDMIVKSDNPCAEALVAKIGYRPLTVDAQSIVSQNTTFLDTESYKTTAGDLSTFMASLATGQISLNQSSQNRLIDALKRNEFRQGVPAGATGQVADKVGFLNGLLHDAAIVYSPSGTYALSVMTDGSSWAKIAELTREIEKLR